MATREVGAGDTIPRSVAAQVTHDHAAKNGVCVRPILRQVTDRETGEVEQLMIPCGSTRGSVCAPCAEKARRLRIQQCAEGWHLEADPFDAVAGPDGDSEHEEPEDTGIDDEESPRQVRSTRRRVDVADLPRLPVEQRSVGRTFTAPNGQTYRPSMFVTLTLPSYGKVVPGAGHPVNPGRYDYRRAAVEALLFTRLFDRWMQNLRRCAGFVVQYFGAIEPQRRLAPHIHLAIRGAIPREVLRQVTRATYVQLWWPGFETPVHVDEHPEWDAESGRYRDPVTGDALPTWEAAVDQLVEPAAVLRFGQQIDIKGIIAPSRGADRAIRYLTKYLTKGVAETYVDAEDPESDYEAHIDRLHAEVRWLP